MSRKILVHANRNGTWATTELVESIKDALVQFGFDAVSEYRNFRPCRGYDFIVQVGSKKLVQNRLYSEIGVLVDTDHIEFREQLGSVVDYSAYTRSLHFFDYKRDLTKENIYHCPIGWSKHFDTDVPRVDLRDSYHMGRHNMDRSRKRFRRLHNLWSPGMAQGRERDEFIVTSKINVNSRARQDYWFTPLHAALIVHKGKLYMQDDCGKDDYHWFKPYMVLFNEEDFGEKYNWWLAHDRTRRDFEQWVHEDVKKNHPFEKYFYAAVGDLLESYR